MSKTSKTRYESPFVRMFTANYRHRSYWQPPIFPASYREHTHDAAKDHYHDEWFFRTWMSKIAGGILGLVLISGGIQIMLHPYMNAEHSHAQLITVSPVFDVISGLFCVGLGVFLLKLGFLRKVKGKAVLSRTSKEAGPNHRFWKT